MNVKYLYRNSQFMSNQYWGLPKHYGFIHV